MHTQHSLHSTLKIDSLLAMKLLVRTYVHATVQIFVRKNRIPQANRPKILERQTRIVPSRTCTFPFYVQKSKVEEKKNQDKKNRSPWQCRVGRGLHGTNRRDSDCAPVVSAFSRNARRRKHAERKREGERETAMKSTRHKG